MTLEHLFDMVAAPLGPTERRRSCSPAHPDQPRPGHPAAEVTFCVVDLETTGGSPADSPDHRDRRREGPRRRAHRIVPGARRTREIPIPPFITHLTGIDDCSVAAEPPIEEILPAFVEFCRGSVFVAHNARFDFTFLNANLIAAGLRPLPGPAVCTARLARRVVWPDVPNVRLQTLARYFRTRALPVHRALADAEACAEVLHGLLDLGGRLGILTLGDLHEAVRARGRPHFGKIRMADHLPNAPGVYLFRGRDGRVLYVGKSKDLRARVKSYFYGDARKKIDDLLAETTSIDSETCATELEALVVEARLIRHHEPKYNRRGKTWRRYAYLKVDPAEAFPRVKIVRAAPPGEGAPTSGRSAPHRPPASPRRPSRRSCRSAGAPRPWARGHGSRRARSPTWAGASHRATAASTSSATESSSGGSSPPCLPGRAPRSARATHGPPRRPGAVRGGGLVRDRLRALADALARERIDAWLVGAGPLAVRDGAGATIRFVEGSLVRGDEAEPLPVPCVGASGPTSWRRCVAGSAPTTHASKPAAGPSPNRWTAVRRSPASRRACVRPGRAGRRLDRDRRVREHLVARQVPQRGRDHVTRARPDLPDPEGAVTAGHVLIDGRVVTNPRSQVRADASVVVKPPRALRGRTSCAPRSTGSRSMSRTGSAWTSARPPAGSPECS